MSNEPKDSKNESIDGMASGVQAIGKAAHIEKIFGTQSHYTVDNSSAFNKFANALIDNSNPVATLETWIEFMKSTPEGLHEGLENFLLKNPDQFRVDENIRHGASPAALQRFSNMMIKVNNKEPLSDFSVELALKGVGQNFVNTLREYLDSRETEDQVQITSRPVEFKVSLNEWIEMMEQSENGLNPALKEFVLGNPDLYNPNLNEGDGVTPRSLALASMVLSQPKQGVLAAHTLQYLLGDDVLQRFTKHIKSKVEYYNDLMEKFAPNKKEQDNTLER